MFGQNGKKGGKGGRKGGKGGKAHKADAGVLEDPVPSMLTDELVQEYTKIFGPPDPEAVRNLMINYIPNRVTEEDLKMVFQAYGPIEHIRIICNKNTNESKGYGFVKYLYGFSAFAAMQLLTGYQLFHKKLKVSYAEQEHAARLLRSGTLVPKWTEQQDKFYNYYLNYQSTDYAYYFQMKMMQIGHEAAEEGAGANGNNGYGGQQQLQQQQPLALPQGY